MGLSSDHFSTSRTTLNLFELFKIRHEYNSLRQIYTLRISFRINTSLPFTTQPLLPAFLVSLPWIFHALVTAVLCDDLYGLPSYVVCNHRLYTYAGIARCDFRDHGMMVSHYRISQSPHGGPNGNGIIGALSLKYGAAVGLPLHQNCSPTT